jgi:predicted acylesterase/phospholipase RssA
MVFYGRSVGQHDLGCILIQLWMATYNADGGVRDSRDIVVVVETFQRNVIVVVDMNGIVAFDLVRV